MKKIKLEITVEEANTILAALGQQPYLKVADLIQNIQGQGASQLNGNSQAESIEKVEREILEHA